ncbi:MAG: hypothetical protein DRQ88_09170 [Epsilonproteobacteria bacterium]|nr:MAG: hypothetical protein DRQ89_09300 [Campylobacterota bacterium]RLA65503.1 MAG: hypothetical protein DRQ88_09170 [Campylobacterota bacterium]
MDFNWVKPPPIFSDKIKHLSAFFNTDAVLKNYPSLEPIHGRFSDSRKAEYIAGRFCAIKALASKGIEVDHILSNEDRTPIWPKNTVGSITHSKNFISVAISIDKSIKSIGHDCEFIVSPSLAREMINNILFDKEKELIFGDIQEFVTLAYSAKECFFKAVYPLTKSFFYFEHAQIVEINSKDKTFKIRAKREFEKKILGDNLFTGKYFISKGIVHTGLEINYL